ncbi:ExeM/NucH family extracellular endonuclease [Microbacterium sp.]|uniref:ExeM/NucH family extracellular endonuclease n=1 Tax=Microbacterium sp. TaxID=51671 RepID=UPI0025D81C1E|nr:ExeM/NucH family extracellular endonuclease [Microbacterium sp.]
MTQSSHPFPARLIATASAVGLVLTGFAASAPALAAVSPTAAVVINEVYGGGGNSGAVLKNDFVELVNVSDATADLSGWSLQYASSAGAFTNVQPLSGTIAPGSSFLVQEAAGSGGSEALPAPDLAPSPALALSATGGKLALVHSTTALSGATGNAGSAPSVVDFVGWGPSASDFAGSAPAPATTNTTSVSRSATHANTGDNAADFTAGAPTPKGSGATGPVDPGDPAAVSIAQIQGTGAASPLAGRTVTTTGVVTARYPTGGFDGYVIQTAGTGGALDLSSHTASDAVFVYSPAGVGEVAAGQTVRVTGVVSEFNGLTELTVAAGGATRVTDAAAPLPATVTWPRTDAQRESLESMLIAPQGAYTVSNTYTTNQYGEVGLASGDQPLRQWTDVARPGTPDAAAVKADNAARAVTLDDGASTNFLSAANSGLTPPYVSLTEPLVVGARATFTQPLIVDYRNSAWKLNPTQPLVGDGSGRDEVDFSNPRTDAPAAVGGDVSVASFNVLNYFTTLGDQTASCEAYPDRTGNGLTVRDGCDQRGAWDAADLKRQQDKIVNAIDKLDADVVGLMEIENSAKLGERPDEATATLVDALNAAAGTSKWAYVPSSSELPDVALQDVITNAIIYQPAAVARVGASRALGTQSADDQAFGNAREPIAQVFRPVVGGDDLLFVVNHLKSKGSAGPWPGDADTGDGQGASNESRVRQATALRDWVASIQGDTRAVALAGDFNSYSQEDPLQVLYRAGYADAEQALHIGKSSYSFSGLSGSLDHVLLNKAALARATGGDIWNINSGESVALEYSRYNVHGTLFYAPDEYRSSDHDPVKVGLSADQPPVDLTLLGINDFHGRIDANTVKFAGTVEKLKQDATGPVLLLSSGDNIGASLFASSVAKDKPTIDVLNALGMQATAVGNHEFDRGWIDLRDRVAPASDYPQLGANVYLKGTTTPALPAYELLDAGGLTVGVIGAVTEETPSLVSPGGIGDLEFGDPVTAVNRVAAQLSDGDPSNGEADVLVAMYHEGAAEGTPDGATLDEELAAGGAFAHIVDDTSPKVDAIFTGHTHKQYAWSAPIPGTDRTRPVVQTGSYGANVGRIVLTVDPDTGSVSAHTETNVPRLTTDDATLISTYPRVAKVNDIVTAARTAAAEIGSTGVAEVSGDITTAFAGGAFVNGAWTGGSRDDRASESALGNLVANALRDSLADLPNGAVIGVTNPGGLRDELWDTQAEFGATAVPGLPDGTISFSQANAVLPFNNTMALVSLTGAQFTALLEEQWQRDAAGNIPSRPYLQLGLSDNVTYTYDSSRPEGSRITSVTVDGKALDPAATYRIGTLSFLATGGDNFREFTKGADYVDTGLVDYEAWIDYLADHSPVAPSFAKRAVQVTGAPSTVAPGDEIAFDVSGINLTSRGAPENTALSVRFGDTELGTAALVNGAGHVSVTLPADTPPGAGALELVSTASGTTVTVPFTIEESTPRSSTTLSLSRTSAAFGTGGTVRATARVSMADAAVTSGTVEFVVGDTVIGSVAVGPTGVARADLALPGGRHAGSYDVVARFTGTKDAAPSASAPVAFTVTKATTTTSLVALLPFHINGLLPSTLVAAVGSGGAGATGTVEFHEGGATGPVVGTAPVKNGLATLTLGRLSRGTHTYTAVFVPANPADVAGSHSGRATVLVLL